MAIQYGDSDSDSDSEYTLHELTPLPRDAPLPPPPAPTPSALPTPALPQQSGGGGRKRRRAVSPSSFESETRRLRVPRTDHHLDVLATLSPENQGMVFRAAEVGLNREEPRPRAINIRYLIIMNIE